MVLFCIYTNSRLINLQNIKQKFNICGFVRIYSLGFYECFVLVFAYFAATALNWTIALYNAAEISLMHDTFRYSFIRRYSDDA